MMLLLLTVIASLISHLHPEALHARQIGAGAVLTEQSVGHRDLEDIHILVIVLEQSLSVSVGCQVSPLSSFFIEQLTQNYFKLEGHYT